jgi:hypothetical protein
MCPTDLVRTANLELVTDALCRHADSVDTVRSGVVLLTHVGPLLARTLPTADLSQLADLVANALDGLKGRGDAVVAQHGSAIWTFLRAKVLRAFVRSVL